MENRANDVDFGSERNLDGEWVGGYRSGLTWRSGACEYSPVARVARIIRFPGDSIQLGVSYIFEKRLLAAVISYCIQLTNRKDENDRKDHANIPWSHKLALQ